LRRYKETYKIKIVYVLHDRLFYYFNSEEYKIWLSTFLNICDEIQVMNIDDSKLELSQFGESILNKMIYVKHPNYIRFIKDRENDFRKKYGYNEDDIVFLFYGKIATRKNLSSIINAFNVLNSPKAKLLIFGHISKHEISHNETQKIKDEIKKNKNIKFVNKYIKHSDRVFNTADIVVGNPQIEYQLNSATWIDACSHAKTFIYPNIAHVMEIKDKSIFFSIDASKDNHSQLVELFTKISNMSRKKLKQMGQKCFDLISKDYSEDVYVEGMKKLFKS
jgi:glycosyltransferase involved in cell wall biosynthesis